MTDCVDTEAERGLLERATPDRKRDDPRDLHFYVRAIARLGGYLDRAADPPPGTTVIWRGFARLADLVEGARIVGPRSLIGDELARRGAVLKSSVTDETDYVVVSSTASRHWKTTHFGTKIEAARKKIDEGHGLRFVAEHALAKAFEADGKL